MKTHNNERKMYSCDSCDNEYLSKHNLYLHTKKYHRETLNIPSSPIKKVVDKSARKQFICDICEKIFYSKEGLTRHKLAQHETSYEGTSCHICHKKFKYETSLRTHLKTHDEQRKMYSCESCSKEYTTNDNLVKHTKKHHSQTENK